MRVEHTKISAKTYTAGHLKRMKLENPDGTSQQHEISDTKRRKVAAAHENHIDFWLKSRDPSVRKTLF